MADVQKIKELRNRTGAGIDQCRAALDKADGDLVKALEALGQRVPRTREGVILREGVAHSYNHGGRIAVIVEVNCETDFVARSDAFQDFATAVAMQVAATSPKYIDSSEMPGSDEPVETVAVVPSAPSEVLLEQPWVYDESKTIGHLLDTLKLKVGEEVRISRVVRIERGGDMTVLPSMAPTA